jgi:uncharacterized protein YbjT (DUF2867 family)
MQSDSANQERNDAMAEKKIIAVVGATGAQGGGLVRAIQADPGGGFTARAITRDVNSDKAKALANLGAEVVAASVDDEASLAKAFKGAHGAYCVTFYWDHLSPEREMAEAHKLATAAKNAGLKHVIWSTLEDTRQWVPLSDNRMPTLMGKYKTPHFDAKGESNKFFTEAGVPTTFFYASFYWENLIFFGMGPKKGGDGKLVFALPMAGKKMAGIGAEDIGRCAYGVFKKGAGYVGKHVGVAGEYLSTKEMADALSSALSQPVGYAEPTWAQFRALGFPGADDLGNMFQFYAEFEDVVNGRRNLAESRALNPQLQNFAQWLAANKSRIPLG